MLGDEAQHFKTALAPTLTSKERAYDFRSSSGYSIRGTLPSDNETELSQGLFSSRMPQCATPAVGIAFAYRQSSAQSAPHA